MKDTINIREGLEILFTKWSGEEIKSFDPISSAGSNRKYYRISGKSKRAIGVFNKDIKENQAFIQFTKSFHQAKLQVPELYISGKEGQTYLLEDLGDQSLFDLKVSEPQGSSSKAVLDYYKKSLSELLKFQFIGKNKIDFSLCYPRAAMDRQSILWDLNYFKYYFLKPKNILFDEQKLEDDFHKFIDLVLEANQDYFMYRDFQARNIMIHNNEPYFIDYQGGRKGALQYDLASLLYQVKAQLPDSTKEDLIAHYLKELANFSEISKETFMAHFHPYVFIRLIQVMGAYGFRGLIEKRSHFIESIPIAIESLKNLLPKFSFLEDLPELNQCIQKLTEKTQLLNEKSKLVVRIKSFAYKAGIPKDDSGHGEGFVFDCRALPNPGRLKEYKHLSGLDKEIIDYLKKHAKVFSFLDHIYQLVDQSIDNYIERDFTNLNINFGCTGGQHRSVFFAESLVKHLKNKYKIKIELTHTQEANW